MAHSVVTDMTKNLLSQSLKQLMRQKPLGKITVQQITDLSGLNRHTFYYHFKDIYELLEWMLEQEAMALVSEHINCMTYEDGLVLLLQYVIDNKEVCMCAYNSLGHEQLMHFFYHDVIELMSLAVEHAAGGLDVADSDKQYVANFYAVALEGLFEQWLQSGMKESPEKVVAQLSRLMEGAVRESLKRFARQPQKD